VRQGEDCIFYANYVYGGTGRGTTAGECDGFAFAGLRTLVACNYVEDVNQASNSAKGGCVIGRGNQTTPPTPPATGDYIVADDSEVSFNTFVNTEYPINFGTSVHSAGNLPDSVLVYNNAVENPISPTDAIASTEWGTAPTFKGNVMDDPGTTVTGLWDGTNSDATPGLTTTNGVKVATASGNCDGNAVTSGYSSLIKYDITGKIIPASSQDIGCHQGSPARDYAQDIRDGAGAT
jgi:hypothetical protein